MKKKVMTMVLAASMLLGMAGCGSSSANDSAAANGNTAGGDQAVAGTEKNDASGNAEGGSQEGTLTVWCWDSFNVDAMKEAGKLYQKDHPDVNINVVETVSSDIQTLVQTYAMSGELDALPDIFLMDDQVFAKYLQNYPDVFADLTDSGISPNAKQLTLQLYYYADDAGNQFVYQDGDDEFYVEESSSEYGENYGVPYDSNTVIACYRTDYLDQAGYTIDDLTDITWDRFIEIGKDVLDKTGMPMLTNVQGEPDLLNMILQSAGISVFDEEGKISLVNNDGLKEAMNVYMDLINAGILQEQTDWSGYQGSINNGTVVGTINGSWICATITSTDQAEQEGNWAVTNMPKLNDYPGATNYSAQGGSTWAISSSSKNYDLAVDFFKTTWAGSTEFYDNILSQLGAIATYLPAADSDAYNQVSDYFGGEAIYSKIVSYGSNIPTINKGIYWSEEKEALGTALTNVLNGSSDLDSAIEEAQATIEFNIGQ